MVSVLPERTLYSKYIAKNSIHIYCTESNPYHMKHVTSEPGLNACTHYLILASILVFREFHICRTWITFANWRSTNTCQILWKLEGEEKHFLASPKEIFHCYFFSWQHVEGTFNDSKLWRGYAQGAKNFRQMQCEGFSNYVPHCPECL